MLSKNNIEKKMLAKDEMSLAKDIEDLEYDFREDVIRTIKEFPKWKQENPEGTFDQYLEENGLKRVELKDGSKIIELDAYRKKSPKIRELNLAAAFDHAKTISSLTDDERDLVNQLLRMSLGKKED